MEHSLSCYRCGSIYTERTRQRCDCGEPLWFDTPVNSDLLSLSASIDSIWTYQDLLPVAQPRSGIAASVGATPLHRLAALDSIGPAIYLKNEGLHPTGSFKDRGSAVGVTAAVEHGVSAIGTVSHGNMAMSTAACAAGTELDCYVFVPDDIPPERLYNIGQFGPTIVRVSGSYGALYEKSLELEQTHDITFVNSDSPLRTAGQKTTGLEIAHEFVQNKALPDAPDAIVLPVSSGGHASATWKGLRELAEAGLIETVPRLYFVQAAACAPIARAYTNGASTATALSPDDVGETIAYSIANADPPSGTRALTAARETGGSVLAVTDKDIHAARNKLARRGGISVESACATTLAATEQLVEIGELNTTDHVVLVGTGSGFKEQRTGDIATVEASVEALETVLKH